MRVNFLFRQFMFLFRSVIWMDAARMDGRRRGCTFSTTMFLPLGVARTRHDGRGLFHVELE